MMQANGVLVLTFKGVITFMLFVAGCTTLLLSLFKEEIL